MIPRHFSLSQTCNLPLYPDLKDNWQGNTDSPFTVAERKPLKFFSDEYVFEWFTFFVKYNRRCFVNCFYQWLIFVETHAPGWYVVAKGIILPFVCLLVNLKLKLLKLKRSFWKQIKDCRNESQSLIVLERIKRSIRGIIMLHSTFWKFNVIIKDY